MTCAKRQVMCVITTKEDAHGDFRRFTGTNHCMNPQPVCPREPGEGYEKCRTICHQVDGHAEIQALKAAQCVDLRGGTAVLTGHYWICEPCGAALRDAGIAQVVIEPSK